MTSWMRITLVVFVLIGGTMTFGYWSFGEFNNALSDLESTITSNILTASSSLKKDTEVASSSLETTITTGAPVASSSLDPGAGVASASLQIVASASLGLSFNFPEKDDKIYTGCTYSITWKTSTAITLLGAAIVDAGKREPIDPQTSGLAKDSAIALASQSLDWKVGAVWPGEYYVRVSKINGADVEIRSKVFSISNMPRGLSVAERGATCKKSGGIL